MIKSHLKNLKGVNFKISCPAGCEGMTCRSASDILFTCTMLLDLKNTKENVDMFYMLNISVL